MTRTTFGGGAATALIDGSIAVMMQARAIWTCAQRIRGVVRALGGAAGLRFTISNP